MIPRPAPSIRKRLTELTGDLRQLAAVRRITLDDGPAKNVRALAFSTGGGLDFWVLSDRSMDIGPLWVHGVPLAWQHPGGTLAPAVYDPQSDGGTGIGRALTGFLLTCGLDNVRRPRDGMPMHGTLPLTPARITAHGEDWNAAAPLLFAEGEVVKAHLDAQAFCLSRRIEAPVGGVTLRVIDSVQNIGPEPADFRILYHTNFGFPAVGEATSVSLNGQTLLRHEPPRDGEHAPVMPAACHDATAAPSFCARLERPVSGERRGIDVTVEGSSAALPYVQLWSDPRPRRNIVAIEPSNCDRNPDGTSGPGMPLLPGESWTSTLTYSFALTQPEWKGTPHGHG